MLKDHIPIKEAQMNKLVLAYGLGTLLFGVNVMAEEGVLFPLKVEGFYLGVGAGSSANVSVLSEGHYKDDTDAYNTDNLSDTDTGYILYGGYQINKIIAVEAAYTDYGSFSDTATTESLPSKRVTFKSDPNSFSVYANAGYTFDNGLRPFGQLGLGYLQVNGSGSTDKINIDDGVSLRFGIGLDYAPKELIGFGFRVAYVDDVVMDFNYKANDNGSETDTVLTNLNGLLYIGAQYKF